MKKSFLKLAIVSGVFGLLNSSTVFSQVTNNGDISGTQGKPATIGGINSLGHGGMFRWLGDRLHTLELDTRAFEMQKDGVSERSFVAGFTAKGALVYAHELNDEAINEIAGKNAAMQILPFTISMTEDGRKFFSVAGFALKNMITAYSAGMDAGGYYEEEYGDFFSVVDNLEALILEYDKDYLVDGVESLKLKFVSTDVKLDLLGSSKPGTFLALTAGGAIGLQKTYVTQDGVTTRISGDTSQGSTTRRLTALYGEARYGIEYNTNLPKGWNINAKFGAVNNWYNGKADDPRLLAEYEENLEYYNQAMELYPQELADYNIRKLQYEQQHLNGNVVSDESYEALSNDMKPNQPEKVKHPQADTFRRNLFYLAPSLNISKKISKDGGRPVRIGIGVYGNIPLNDAATGFKTIDLTNSNRELFGAKLFINF